MTSDLNQPYVVGVKGTERARQAVRWAAHAASLHNAPLLLTHAIGIPEHYGGVLPPTPKLLDALAEQGKALLEKTAEFARSVGATDVHTELRDENPSFALRKASRGARALVLGTPEHGRVADTVILGSLAPQLAAHAGSPVVVVHGDQAEPITAPIVVGIDGSPLSERALAIAFEEASVRNAPLKAVHAWTDWYADAKLTLAMPEWPSLAEMEQKMLAERLAGWGEKYPDVQVSREVAQKRPAQALIDSSHDAQLVIVGSRGRGGFTGLLLGSTSQKLIYQAACPVMVVRPEETKE